MTHFSRGRDPLSRPLAVAVAPRPLSPASWPPSPAAPVASSKLAACCRAASLLVRRIKLAATPAPKAIPSRTAAKTWASAYAVVGTIRETRRVHNTSAPSPVNPARQAAPNQVTPVSVGIASAGGTANFSSARPVRPRQ